MIPLGTHVLVHAKGWLEDGSLFLDTRAHEHPMELAIGQRVMPAAFERAVSDMSPGELVEVTIPAAEAYGAYDESLIEEVPLNAIPGAQDFPVGSYITVQSGWQLLRMKVLEKKGDKVVFDHNHELAGHDLRYEIELLDLPQESAIEHELHSDGCTCGCHKLKHQLLDEA